MGKGSLDELREYAVKIELPPSDGDFMFDHWSSNGWKNGSTASKDWMAGMRKWKSQGWLPSQKPQNGSGFQKPGQKFTNERPGPNGTILFDGP